jgi:hypothetical protein
MNIYVRNLSPKISCSGLIGHFRDFGIMTDASVSTYTVDGRLHALGFVAMPFHMQGQSAIDGLQGKGLGGPLLKIQEG